MHALDLPDTASRLLPILLTQQVQTVGDHSSLLVGAESLASFINDHAPH